MESIKINLAIVWGLWLGMLLVLFALA